MTEKTVKTLEDALTTPSAMLYWGKPQNIVGFLTIQAYLYNIGDPHGISRIGSILNDAAQKIVDLLEEDDEPKV